MAKYRKNAQVPFKTLKIKALDSMPVGTIVDYDGTSANVPVGWEVVGNDYSTTEINTGKTWINGKPIYRIVIQFTTTSTTGSWQSRALGISNLEKIIKYDYTYETNSTEMYKDSNYVSSGYNLTTRMNKTDGLFNYLQNGYKNADITLIVEYTKTTD